MRFVTIAIFSFFDNILTGSLPSEIGRLSLTRKLLVVVVVVVDLAMLLLLLTLQSSMIS